MVRQYLRGAPLLAPRPEPVAPDLEALVAAIRAKLVAAGSSSPSLAAAEIIGPAAEKKEEADHLAEVVELECRRSVSEGRPVMNAISGVYHRMVGASPDARVYCGWSHTNSPHALVAAGSPWPKGHWQICGRCYPAERLVAKGRA